MAIGNSSEYLSRFSRLSKSFKNVVGERASVAQILNRLVSEQDLLNAKFQTGPLTPSAIADFYERMYGDQIGSYENAMQALRGWQASYHEALERTNITKSRLQALKASNQIDLTLLPKNEADELSAGLLKVLKIKELMQEVTESGTSKFGFGLPAKVLPGQNEYRDIFQFLVTRRNLTETGYTAHTTVEHPFQFLLEKGTLSFNPEAVASIDVGIEPFSYTPRSAIPSADLLESSLRSTRTLDEFYGAPRPFGNLEAGKRILLMDIETSGLHPGSDILGFGAAEMESYLADDGRVLLRPPEVVDDITSSFRGPLSQHVRTVIGDKEASFAELIAQIRGQSLDDLVNYDENFLAKTNTILERMLDYDVITGYNINRFDIPRLLEARSRHQAFGIGEIGVKAAQLNEAFQARAAGGNYIVDLMDTIVPYIEDQANYVAGIYSQSTTTAEQISKNFVNAAYPAEILADIQTGGTSGYRSMNSLLMHTNFAELIERDGTHAHLLYDAIQRGSHLEDVDAHLEAFFAHYVQSGELKLWPLAEQMGEGKTVLGDAFRASIARSRPVTLTTNIANVEHLHAQIYKNIITQNADADKVVLSVNRKLLEAADTSLSSSIIDELVGEGSGILAKRNGRFIVSTGTKQTELSDDVARNIIRNVVTAAREGDNFALSTNLADYGVTLPNGKVINIAADSIRSLGVTYGEQSEAIQIMENAVKISRQAGMQKSTLIVPSDVNIEDTASGIRVVKDGRLIQEITGDVEISARGGELGNEFVINYFKQIDDSVSSGTEDDVINALTYTTEQAPASRQRFLRNTRPIISATGYDPGFSEEMTRRFAAINDPMAFVPAKNRIIGEVLASETSNIVQKALRENVSLKNAANLFGDFADQLAPLGIFNFKEVSRNDLMAEIIDDTFGETTRKAFVPRRILSFATQELVDEGKMTAQAAASNRLLSVASISKKRGDRFINETYINAVFDVTRASRENNNLTIELAQKLYEVFTNEKKLLSALNLDSMEQATAVAASDETVAKILAMRQRLIVDSQASNAEGVVERIAARIKNGIIESSIGEESGARGPVSRILDYFTEQGINYQHDVPLEEAIGTFRVLETDLPSEVVTYSMPLNEEAVRIAGQAEALNSATEVIEYRGRRVSRLVAHANATAERLKGTALDRLKARKNAAARNAPVVYDHTPLEPPSVTGITPEISQQVSSKDLPMDLPEGYQPVDINDFLPMDLPDEYQQIDAEGLAPMDLPDEYRPVDATTAIDDLFDDTHPINFEPSDAAAGDVIDDYVDSVAKHFEEINPGENVLLKGYRAIKPKLGITLTAAAIAGIGYYTYRNYQKDEIYDETLETQPFQKQINTKSYPTEAVNFNSNVPDPLKTAGVVGQLDRQKIGHYKMGNKKYNHLYGGQL